MANKRIDTLVPDIYSLMEKGTKIDEKQLALALSSLADILRSRLSEDKENNHNVLRMSNLGSNCERQLWYTVNTPHVAESLEPWVRIKFLYGDLIEWLFLYLTGLAGHQVEGQQDELDLHGVKGHRDAIIDGVLVDVKSANSRGFDKFKYHELETKDDFGYLYQLSSYLEASKEDPKVKVKGEAAFLAVDKEMGHVVLDKYKFPSNRDWLTLIKQKREMLSKERPPPRAFLPTPHNKSGNMQLALPCRYCRFKKTCYPSTRTFIYSTGPVYLTTVVKEPEVNET